MCSYYRRFVKDFAKIAQPLTDLLRKDAVIQPLPAQAVEAFEKLKLALTEAPVLAYGESRMDVFGVPRGVPESIIANSP